MTTTDEILKVIPRGGIEARKLYASLTSTPERIDAALHGLIGRGIVVRQLGRYRHAWDALRMPEVAGSVERGIEAHQICRDCGQELPLARFGQHRNGKPWRVCLRCHGQNVTAGNKRYRERRAAITEAAP